VLAGEPTHAAACLDSLAGRGVPISLDDFGTGYSSLVRLRRLPVTEIKIDASFITRLFDSSDNELIVRSVTDLVRALGIRCVAEGVETAEVASALAAMGCTSAQGWFFSTPMAPAAATRWLASHPLAAPRELVPAAPRAAPGQQAPQPGPGVAVSQPGQGAPLLAAGSVVPQVASSPSVPGLKTAPLKAPAGKAFEPRHARSLSCKHADRP
jgi:hypothetical protein